MEEGAARPLSPRSSRAATAPGGPPSPGVSRRSRWPTELGGDGRKEGRAGRGPKSQHPAGERARAGGQRAYGPPAGGAADDSVSRAADSGPCRHRAWRRWSGTAGSSVEEDGGGSAAGAGGGAV